MSGQFKFSPLNLKGNEHPKISGSDHLCNLPGCFRYINAGDWMVRYGTFDLHVDCATEWCNERGVDAGYRSKIDR